MMGYISLGFAVLVLAGLLAGRIFGQRGRQWVLLAVSLAFMSMAGGQWTVLFWFISTAAGFLAAHLLMPCPASGGHGISAFSGVGQRLGRRRLLIAAVAFQLGLLAYFKYANLPFYTLEAWGELTGKAYEFEEVERISLMGISFYTLMVIGYDIDVYRGETGAVRSLPAFSLFTGYFGHFVQGPIDTYQETGKSLASPGKASFGDLQAGSLEILAGLFKKLVISERLAVVVDTVYGDYASYGGWYLSLAAVAFSLQLYTDFSGCMDVVAGVSKLFGVRVAKNFRQPFFSESISEFWRRWHITLGAFLRKYVYIPLGGNRKGRIRKYLNIVAVFFLSGLWHGGQWTFIIGTGLLQCAYMIAGELLEPLFSWFYRFTRIRVDSAVMKNVRRVRTFLLVTVGFVLFRADSLSMAGEIFTGMFRAGCYPEYGEGVFYCGLGRADFAVLLVSLAILFFMSAWRERHGEKAVVVGEGRRTALCFASLFAILLFGFYGKGYDTAAFIYSQF